MAIRKEREKKIAYYTEPTPKNNELEYELFDDLPVLNALVETWQDYDESFIAQN
ncbi:MAG: hypothetical protein MRJ65_11995 [Candidatus Brocadiaceae bacterium]|nr:hypothetical protein [Candidatus Brocadiaceae bacterium]